jgi:colicin import membrane protein
MPKSEELATEFKSLQALALKIDENPDLANEPVEAKPASESRPEPAIQEGEKDSTEEVQETEPVEAADKAEIEPEEIAPTDSEKVRKDKERWNRNWQVMQERNQEAKKVKAEAEAKIKEADERARKAEEEAAKLRSTPAKVPYKDKRGYTVEDYEAFANSQEEEGNWQQSRSARQEAANLRQEMYTAEWLANRQKEIEANPDLRNMDSPLYKETQRLLDEPENPYFTRTTGIKYAVAQAKANLEASSISAVKAENLKLKQELDRLEKLGAIPGRDGAMKRVSNKAFADMTLEEQRAHLYRASEELDAESMRY